LAGWRHVEVSEHRTSEDWAFVMRELSLMYPEAEKIVVVRDNLNIHTPTSFYKVFEPEEAFELSQRFEFHYTPKHGSWLNMAEIELSVLAGNVSVSVLGISTPLPDMSPFGRKSEIVSL